MYQREVAQIQNRSFRNFPIQPDDKVIEYLARPIESLGVQDAINELTEKYNFKGLAAFNQLLLFSSDRYIHKFPHIYLVQINDLNITSMLVSTYADEATLCIVKGLLNSMNE